MRAPSRPLRVALQIALAVGLPSGSALADMTKDQCVDANSKAQDLRRDGKLSAAREQLRACSSPSCPAVVSDDCTRRLDDVEKAQPTIVFDAKDGSGRDVSAVKVSVDGRSIAERLDGSPLQVDPGEHTFVFTTPEKASVTQTFVIKEAEKERRERIVLASPSAPAAPLAPSPDGALSSTPPPGGEAPAGGLGTQRILGLVAGGVGVAGIAVGSVFGVMTLSEGSQQQTACASSTNCPHPTQAASDHSTGETDRTLSTVGFIAGGVLLAGGAVLFFTARHPESTAAARLVFVPSVGPGGGALLVKGMF